VTEIRLNLPEEYEGERLDKTLAELLKRSRSFVQQAMEFGGVLLNGAPAKKSAVAAAGDKVLCRFAAPVELAARPEAIPLDVRYEDGDLLVVNKPQGMVVHPAPGNAEHTLVNALLYHCEGRLSGINGVLRPGIVHRIDKDTGGLLVVAKNDFAHAALAEQIAAHSFTREYRAVVHGTMKAPEGVVDAPVGRSERDRKKMAVTASRSGPPGKPARTHYFLEAQCEKYADLRLALETGRTHQIRVHMAHIGHPVAGDPVYGPQPPVKGLRGQCLYARLIGFIHPRTGEYIEIEAELPEWYEGFLQSIGGES
jgi:23S rRNA pseudouridine1911/1915/1917 synthase